MTHKRIGKLITVPGPGGKEVKIGFWDDGSILFRITHPVGAMTISQFFSGRENWATTVRISPLP